MLRAYQSAILLNALSYDLPIENLTYRRRSCRRMQHTCSVGWAAMNKRNQRKVVKVVSVPAPKRSANKWYSWGSVKNSDFVPFSFLICSSNAARKLSTLSVFSDACAICARCSSSISRYTLCVFSFPSTIDCIVRPYRGKNLKSNFYA